MEKNNYKNSSEIQSVPNYGEAGSAVTKNFLSIIKTLKFFLIIVLPTLFSFTNTLYGQTAVVTVDRPDYPPGDTVLINGSGFLAGETVTLQVLMTDSINDNTVSPAHQPWQVTADSLGNFQAFWIVPPDGDELGSHLILTADGQTSLLHAEVLFKDGASCQLSAISGTSSRCQGSGTSVYSATSNAATGWIWSITGTGNTISPVNGVGSTTVSWSPTFSGTAIVTVSVTGCTSTSTKTLSIIVNPLPVITVQPAASKTICAGTSVTFTLAASNVTSYQWQKAGVNISGATSSSYIITSPTTADAAIYKVIVTNSCGSVISSDAVLNVNTSPTITCPINITSNTDPGLCLSRVSYSVGSTGIPSPSVTYSLTGATSGSGSGTGTGLTFNFGTTKVTINSTNLCGNANCSFSITVTDNEKPIITTSANISVNNDPIKCGALVTVPIATATDNCSVGAVTGTRSDALALNVLYPVGTTTITWAVSDIHGNAALPKTQIVTVTDNELPVITASSNINISNDAGKCGASVTIVDATATDNCSVGAVTGIRSDASALSALYPVGTTTITWTVTDIHGNAALAKTQTITVTDNELPVITAAADIIQAADAGKCGASVAIVDATATDNCSVGAVSGTRSDALALNVLYPVGTTTITWTVSDIHGNAALPKTQTITVTDNELPVITASSNINVSNDAGKCGASVAIVDATATDNCSVGAVTGIRSDASALSALYPVGTTTITWAVSDINGNAALSKTQIVTVTDNELPVITASPNINASNDAGKCGALVTIVDATATDNCSVGAVTGIRSDASALSALYPVGTTTITWAVSDINGNAALAKTQIVTVTDNELPVITASSNINVSNDAGKCGASVTIVDATATDNCSVGAVTGTRSDALALNALYPVGTTTITWTVSDVHGNAALSKTQTVIVTDNELPVITTAAGIIQTGDAGKCGALVTIVNATATDNCGVGAVTGTRSDALALNVLYPVGTTTITWTVSDIHGNAALAKTQIVTVADNELPVITASSNTNVSNDAGKCGASVAIVAATATDNCSVGAVTGIRSDASALSALYPVGTTTITWAVSDINGNAALAKTQIVTVADNELPVITAAADIIQTADAGKCGAAVTIVDATATDNCSAGAVTGTRSDALALNVLYPVGTTTITWAVSDIHGNAALAKTQIVTVTDNELPVITASSNINVSSDDGKCGASVAIVDATATDNCSAGAVTGTRSDALALNVLYPVGTTTITWTVTDIHGNAASSKTQTVIVTDNELPVITAAAGITQTADAGKCGAAVTIVDATATDNCSVGVVTGTRSDALALSALYPVGTTTITWAVSDIHGNAALPKTQIITITDNELPVISAAADIIQTADAGKCGASITIVDATATDNCSVGAVTGTRSDALALNVLYPVGTTTITWTVSDVHGNAALAKTQIVTVTDNELPVITASSNINVSNDAGKCGASVAIVDATATDNCSVGAVTGTRSDALALNVLYPVGTTTITWTVSDVHGNAALAKTQTVIVTDNELPVITAAVGITQTADAGKCGALVTIVDATATDNCSAGAVTGTRSDALALNVLYPVGTTTITWTVTDIHGNAASSKTQTVIVTDNELPVITAAAGITQTADAGKCGAAVTIIDATATDNCSVGAVTGTRSDALTLSALYPVGTTTITWTVSDVHGNAALAKTQTVIVTDNEKPIITTSANISINNDPTKCGALVTVPVATATDNCSVGAVTGTRSDALALSALYPVGTTTITWTVSDIHGNAALPKIQTVIVTDNEKPTISCPSNITVNYNPAICGASVAITNPTIGDNCGVQCLKWSMTGATTNNSPIPGINYLGTQTFNLGITTITYTVKDPAGNSNTCTFSVTVIPDPVTASVSVTPNPQQYSDSVTFFTRIIGGYSSCTTPAAATVTFKVGTQVMGTVPLVQDGADLIATLANVQLMEPFPFGTAPAGQMSPGAHTVTACFNTINTTNFSLSNAATTLTITQENDPVTYSGIPYFSTASATSCVANITLSATVTDTIDRKRGDVRNSFVTFHSGSLTGPVLGTANLQPVLVNNADPTVGTVSSSFFYTLGSSDCINNKGTSIDVYAVVSNYYCGNNAGFPGTITISVPGLDAVTGGGYLINTNSIGTYAGTSGSHVNFGFTMKFNKNGGSAKGQCNIIIRSNNKTYQVKSNAINSLSTSGKYANFSTKASLTDVTNPANPISLGGNLDLLVDMYDASSGGHNDEISISLKNGSIILYSSNWNGSMTTRKVLAGGNINVGGTSSSRMTQSKDTLQISSTPLLIYPNPTTGLFTMEVSKNDINENVEIKIINSLGQIIFSKIPLVVESFIKETIELDANIPSGIYLLQVRIGEKFETTKILLTR